MSRLRLVPVIGVSGTELTLDYPGIEGAKQIRPDTVDPLGSVAADFAIGEEGRR